MNRCPFVNQNGVQCGRPDGHGNGHENGTLTPTPGRDVWTIPSVVVESVPVFSIKASDPFACSIIRIWITLASTWKDKDGKRIISDDKINGACDRYGEFKQYQLDHGYKVPD
jgi:hypothetical protein